MPWTCPECGKSNEALECPCGYAYYRILGTKPDDPPATVQQSCDYLVRLWKEKAAADDPVARKRAAERLRKIQDAYAVFRQLAPERPAGPPRRLIIYAAAAAVIVVALVAALMAGRGRPKEQPFQPSPMQPSGQTGAQPEQRGPQEPAVPAQGQQTVPPLQQTVPAVPPAPSAADTPGERTEQWAMDTIRKSYAMDKFSTVDEIVRKWDEQRPASFKAVGWQAKKMDAETYLVSYLATDGQNTQGVYFDINTSTGLIRHLANHLELQEKYGIKYKK